jgi:outer membrane beta-barrel protein
MKALRNNLVIILAMTLSFNAFAEEQTDNTVTDETSVSMSATSEAAADEDLDNDELSAEDEDAMAPGEKYVPTMEEQLDSLALPSNQAPANVSTERLYSVQTRYAPLLKRYELGLIGGYNMTNADFVDSKSVGANVRYHFNDKHSFGLTYMQFENRLDATGQDLLERKSLLPDVDYISSIAEASYGYNLFYGKFRLGMSKVFYFDQYWNFGAGTAELNSGITPMINIEGGLAFWMGKRGSIRLGFKNLVFEESNLTEKRINHDLLSTLSINILFGGE